MPRTGARHGPAIEEAGEDPGPLPDVDERTPEGQSKLRHWAQRVERQNRQLRLEADEVPRLRLENAALRAGIDVDDRVGKLLLQTYEGPPEPGAVRAAFEELVVGVLSHSFAAGHTLGSLAERVAPDVRAEDNGSVELGDDPTEAERALARAQRALTEVEPR